MEFSGARSTRLELGARGTVDGARFALVGRTRVRGPRGTTWNDWTLRFDDGRSAFLSETIDALTLYEDGSLLPSFDAFVPGGGTESGFVAVERGRATREMHWGEVEPSPRCYAFVDLSGRRGPATIDFGGEGEPPSPRTFVGRHVTALEMGLSALRFDEALDMLCPVPELSRPKGVELWLSVGDAGCIAGSSVTVVGSLSRSMQLDDSLVRWDEYLLVPDDASDELRWLVVCDGHFNLVKPATAGLVARAPDSGVLYDDEPYEAASEGIARVEWASGRLPSETTVGETARVREFVRPPHVLTEERTVEGDDFSLSWSRGAYVEPSEIARGFKKRALPRPVGVAPNAPPDSGGGAPVT